LAVIVCAVVAGLAWPNTAYAYSAYKSAFNTRYGTAGTRLDTCNTCHGTTSPFNPYGDDVLAQLNTGKTIDQALAAIEPVDSDGDTFTNKVEIDARTFPGDATDHPTATAGTLSAGSVSPPSGGLTTSYTYVVQYTNAANTLPSAVWVGIWSQPDNAVHWKAMTASNPADTNTIDGKWYQYSTTLDPGTQAYRFVAKVGASTVYWPTPAGTYAAGPAVNPVVLSSGYVSPTSGTPATEFTYRVKYWHAGNLLPDVVWLGIWSQSKKATTWYQMWPLNAADKNCMDGKWYTVHLHGLDASAHAYRFVARRGTDWAYCPAAAGTYLGGPTVTP